ncbi:MAG: hypothetical protein E7554_00180 [Ruminococcaceae bacterium]|nr:hypothetical protein [Oscillospiraceae bacterium]
MKKSIRRILCGLAAVLMLCSAAACGSEPEQSNDFAGTSTTTTAAVQEPTGTGFSLNHAVAEGFGLGTDTLDDIRIRFGEPTSVDTQEFTALTIVTAEYPFGHLIFNGGKDSKPVLTEVSVSPVEGTVFYAPTGIPFGTTADVAVETIYTGSAAMLGGNYEQDVTFYGDGFTAPSGRFVWLTAEFVTTSTTARYAAEYIAPGYADGASAKMTLYFNTDGQLINYTLLYVG